MNELGYLVKLSRISSVSGGSITAGLLGLKWNRLAFYAGTATRFVDEVVTPIRRLADSTIDVSNIVVAILTPGSIADKVAGSYGDYLFGDATLQDLPDAPRFVINATSVQSGALWRFSKPFMADWRVGLIRSPTVPLATVVAASSVNSKCAHQLRPPL